MFFDELKNCKLERKKGKNTLGREDLDRLFGINNILVLTPNQELIASLASTTYLLGLLDVNITSFTSIAMGFLASYEDDKEFNGTFLVSSSETYIKNEIITLCRNKMISDNENLHLYRYMINQLEQNVNIVECSLNISKYINENDLNNFIEKTNVSMKKFDKANQQNCSDNHYVICQLVFKDKNLADDLNIIKELNSEDEISKKIYELAINKYNMDNEYINEYYNSLISGYKLYKQILEGFILPGYLTYRGRDRQGNAIEQNSQILNDTDRIKFLIDLLGQHSSTKNPYDIIADVTLLLNLCSTDYSADMAYDFLKSIKEYNGNNIIEDSRNLIDNSIPQTINNNKQKEDTRSSLYRR